MQFAQRVWTPCNADSFAWAEPDHQRTEHQMSKGDPTVTQIEEGSPVEVKNRYGKARTVTVGRVWKVELDGREIGRIRYRMIRRERKGRGMRYVYSRWQSPGWEVGESDDGYWFEKPSKKACIESLMREARLADR